MPREVMDFLRPSPGEIAVDCTLGGGGHAEAILARLQPGGQLLGLDADALTLPHATIRLRSAGYDETAFRARQGNFSRLREWLDLEGIRHADVVLADLGLSSLQADDPERGFHYKVPGPLDMRMDRSLGLTAAQFLDERSPDHIAALLATYADEPHAAAIATLITARRIHTTHLLERTVRLGLNEAFPTLTKAEVKASVRRTFQALRMAVNDELPALDALLMQLPDVLAPGGRVAIITFHSGEDRRVKQAFREGLRRGVYADTARTVTRSAKDETWSNRRAASAKLRWAIRA